MRLANKDISNANFMPRPSVIYGGGTAWFETQSLSGNFDPKIVLFHSKNHFRRTQTHPHTQLLCRGLGFFFCLLRFYYVGRWGLCFTTLRLSAHFYPSRHEQWCEKPDKQGCCRVLPWQRQRHRCLFSNGGLSASMGILGHTLMQGSSFLKHDVAQSTWIQLRPPPPPFF